LKIICLYGNARNRSGFTRNSALDRERRTARTVGSRDGRRPNLTPQDDYAPSHSVARPSHSPGHARCPSTAHDLQETYWQGGPARVHPGKVRAGPLMPPRGCHSMADRDQEDAHHRAHQVNVAARKIMSRLLMGWV
jgi:hypothetical protein